VWVCPRDWRFVTGGAGMLLWIWIVLLCQTLCFLFDATRFVTFLDYLLVRVARCECAPLRTTIYAFVTSRRELICAPLPVCFARDDAVAFSAKEISQDLAHLPRLCAARAPPNVRIGPEYASCGTYIMLFTKSMLSPGQGLRTRAKRTTGKQGLRYTPRPEAPPYYPALTRTGSRS
jgi:hypothetical protein